MKRKASCICARVSMALLLAVPVAAIAADPPATTESAEASEEFKPPPGFRTRKRGEVTLYCRKETPLGSRFQTEKCYDEAGLRQLRLVDLEKTEMLERIKACGSANCAAN